MNLQELTADNFRSVVRVDEITGDVRCTALFQLPDDPFTGYQWEEIIPKADATDAYVYQISCKVMTLLINYLRDL